jgi:phosphate-selective porin OprO/OprP
LPRRRSSAAFLAGTALQKGCKAPQQFFNSYIFDLVYGHHPLVSAFSAGTEGLGMRRTGRRGRLLNATAVVVGFMILSGSSAGAQDAPVGTAQAGVRTPQTSPSPVDPREARIEHLEAEVRALAAEVEDLKASRDNGIKQIQAAQDLPAAQSARPQVGLTNARPQIRTGNGAFSFALRSVVQFDAAHYDVSPTPIGAFASGTDFRRARLGFDATAYKDWNFSLWGEFGGSGGESASLSQAFIEYAGLKPFKFADPIRLRAGAWATPAGLEDATSNTEMLFLERPAVEEMIRGLDAGDAREGVGLFATGSRWYFSGVLTSRVAGVSAPPVYGQQAAYLTRLAFNPLRGKDWDVHLGATVQGVITPASTGATGPAAETLTLNQQPELRVDANGTKLVSTGEIEASGMTIYGAETGASFRNVYVAGEYYRLDVARTAVGNTASPFNPSFSGWYVQGAWTLTGERHVWSPSNGGFRGIVQPQHNFSLGDGGWGAWEIAARYSVLDLNDDAGAAGQTAPTGGIRGGVQRITTVGLNWYPNGVIRFLLDFQNGHVDRLSAAGADIGAHFDNVSFRSQLAF